jgi:hypothetical protein
MSCGEEDAHPAEVLGVAQDHVVIASLMARLFNLAQVFPPR